jgi:hypothetical protein
VVGDERGVDRIAARARRARDEPRLLVPGLGTTTVLAPSGELIGGSTSARARTTTCPAARPLVSESEARSISITRACRWATSTATAAATS